MKRMMPLRIIAICSNVLFAMFGAVAHIYPVLILHTVLFPVNIARLIEILPITKRGHGVEPSTIARLVRTTKLQGAERDLATLGGRSLTNLCYANQNDVGKSRCETDFEGDKRLLTGLRYMILRKTDVELDPPASEFFNILRENSRNWTGRASIEIQLGLKLTKNLSAAHSVPDAITAYQQWLDEEMGAYAEDARRLMSHGQKLINASSRLLSNG
jgi:hypothetical protein